MRTTFAQQAGAPLRYDTVHSRGDSSLRSFKRRMRTMKRRLSQLCGREVLIIRYEGSLAERDLRCVVAHVA